MFRQWTRCSPGEGSQALARPRQCVHLKGQYFDARASPRGGNENLLPATDHPRSSGGAPAEHSAEDGPGELGGTEESSSPVAPVLHCISIFPQDGC